MRDFAVYIVGLIIFIGALAYAAQRLGAAEAWIWIGVVAPILPSRVIAECRRSSVLGPVGWCHARCSTPSPVRANPTWSIPDPSSLVTRFHGAAVAVGAAARAAITAVRKAARSVIARL